MLGHVLEELILDIYYQKAALGVVINSIRKEYIRLAQKQLNLYFALDKYFNKQENNMENVRESLRTKINSEHQM